jgi:hypothetical protein
MAEVISFASHHTKIRETALQDGQAAQIFILPSRIERDKRKFEAEIVAWLNSIWYPWLGI